MHSPLPNPLLNFNDLPLFDAVLPAHIAPAIDHLLTLANTALERVTEPDFPSIWSQISAVLDTATEQLTRAWGAINHLNSVADTHELRAAYNEALPKVTEFWTRLGSDDRLSAKYMSIDTNTLNPEQRQAHTNAMRGFVLGGCNLVGEAKARFVSLQEQMAALSQKFSENTLDATDAFSYYAREDEIDGIPVDVLATAHKAARADQATGYKLTLKAPCYLPVMQFARNSALRERLYRANVTRASDQATPEFWAFDNTAVMQDLLSCRQEEAKLLGFSNYAELSLVPKMAQSPEQVVAFLHNLARKARPFAENDLADMRRYATEHLQLSDPQAWDWAFVSERLKESRFAFNEQEVKAYFTAPKVLAGLFNLVEKLFDVSICASSAPVWHSDVQFFQLQRNGQLIGQFYLDQGARTGKRSGAWMDDVRARWLRPDNGQLQTPVAHLVCNFADGVDGRPALLTHDDVITLFHEFGHGLHHMLTRVDERDVSGISGVEWDAVELPSQFMENFCWEWDVLQHMTCHVETGEPMPRHLYDKLVAAKNFQSGLQTLRQVELALFDMLLHMGKAPLIKDRPDIMALLDTVRQDVSVLQVPIYNRMPNTFGHIFSGGYAAGYYSYKWAEVLSADAYEAFELAAVEVGTTVDPTTGKRFRETILEAGGSRPALESFVAFKGREPSPDALLRHQGMVH